MKRSALITALIIAFNIITGVAVYAGNIVFCDIDFENTASPFGGMVLYKKENNMTVGGNENNHYAVIEKINSSDCHMDYTVGMKVDRLVAEADFTFGDIGTEMNPFYFIGASADEKTRCDLDVLYVKPDMGLYFGGEKCCTLEKNRSYRISTAVKLDERIIQVYVNGTRLG